MGLDTFRAEEMFRKIMEKLDGIDSKIMAKRQRVHPLDGDALLDNQDMCQLFGVTKRTIARYRQKKLVSYYVVDGRTYYKASEIQGFLKKKGKALPETDKPNSSNLEAYTCPLPATKAGQLLLDKRQGLLQSRRGAGVPKEEKRGCSRTEIHPGKQRVGRVFIKEEGCI
jgi:hypothetical protein